MKKKFIYTIVVLCLLIFFCWIFSYALPQDTEETVIAEITEVHNKYIVVDIKPDMPGYQAVIPDNANSENYKKGDIVSITYRGSTSETAPPWLDGVSKIEFTEKND